MAALGVISDMDGVIYRGHSAIPGAQGFIDRLRESGTPFLFLTNNSEQTPLDLVRKLEGLHIRGVTERSFFTSAMATAQFLATQKPGGSAYVIGGGALSAALYQVGYSVTEVDPDYVVVGKTASFNFEMLRAAVRLIDGGARFVGTNPDMVDPIEGGTEPAAGTLLAAIEAATGMRPYVVGKPNSLMMIYARQLLGVPAEHCVMIGDRMDTDVVGGLEAGMRTCLVLSGVSTAATPASYPYRPTMVVHSVADLDLPALQRAVAPIAAAIPVAVR